MKKIGIVGCGVIGSSIALFIEKNLRNKAEIRALCDIDLKKANELSKKIESRPVVCDIETLIKKSDLVIESANPDVSSVVIGKAVKFKKHALIMSTGGLLKKPALLKQAKAKGVNIYIPSGAVCGLDGLASAAIGSIKSVRLTTRKPPKGLKGAPYLKLKGIDVDRIKKETVIFSGNALSAIKYFPQNINVAATLSLAGIGPKRTQVRIVASPDYTRNTHEVEIEGEFGKIFTRAENLPSRENPKTSQLAIFSAFAKLKEVV